MYANQFLTNLLALLGPSTQRLDDAARTLVKLLVIVEGRHDLSFLRGISLMLHAADAAMPDLGALERVGRIVMLPVGGGDALCWSTRLAPLGLPEFHLLDREMPPATKNRRQAVAIVNKRPNCRAYLTQKRAIENYLHPQAVTDVSGLDFNFGDEDDVADLVAGRCYDRERREPIWELLPARARKRCREAAKRWLNNKAVARMTPALLDQRDPTGEVRVWLATISRLAC
jgi:hypothetical protein